VAAKKVDACGWTDSKYMANHPGELRGHEYDEKVLPVQRPFIHSSHPYIHPSICPGGDCFLLYSFLLKKRNAAHMQFPRKECHMQS
jgi:hypothetical protein